jgi:hypothetical protein
MSWLRTTLALLAFLTMATGLHASLSRVNPAFVEESLTPSGRTYVLEVAVTAQADIVLLANGLDQNFRTGALCEAIRGESVVAELVLVAVTDTHAAALIVSASDDVILVPGDFIKLKTVQFTN